MLKKLARTLAAATMLATGLSLISAPASHATVSSDSSLSSATVKLKGAIISSLPSPVTDPQMLPISANHVSVTLTSGQASDTTGVSPYDTIFTTNEAHATIVVKRLTTLPTVSSFNAASDFLASPTALNMGDYIVVKITAQDGVFFSYYGFSVITSMSPPTSLATHTGLTITAPVIGAVPSTMASDSVLPAQYLPTGSVTWSPNDSTFQSGVAYTATVTIQPRPAFNFTGAPSNAFSVSGASSTSATYAAGE